MGFDSNPSFVHPRITLGVRLALCVVLSVGLLAADSYFKILDPVRQLLALPLYPLQWAVNEPARLTRQANSFMSTQSTLQTENARLREENLRQSVLLSRQTTVNRELTELKQLLGLYQHQISVVSAAEVLNTGNDPFAYRLIIGSSSGKEFNAGQPVLDSGGLLGLVTKVQPLGTEVTLAINKGQMIPVMIERTGERTILYGYGGGVEVRYLPQYADVKQGDILVTSGIDGVYPPGLPVARITTVERNAGAQFVRMGCQPLAGMQRARYVLVIENAPARPVPRSGAESASAPAAEIAPAASRRESGRTASATQSRPASSTQATPRRQPSVTTPASTGRTASATQSRTASGTQAAPRRQSSATPPANTSRTASATNSRPNDARRPPARPASATRGTTP